MDGINIQHIHTPPRYEVEETKAHESARPTPPPSSPTAALQAFRRRSKWADIARKSRKMMWWEEKGKDNRLGERETDKIPYQYQGDRKWETEEMKKVRDELRWRPAIENELSRFWRAFPKRPNHELGIERRMFVDLYIRLAKVLVKSWDFEKASTCAVIDWGRDMKGQKSRRMGMDYNEFCQSLFELVDIWTESVDEMEYVVFLKRLFYAVAKLKAKDARGEKYDSYQWKKLSEVEPGSASKMVDPRESTAPPGIPHSHADTANVKLPKYLFKPAWRPDLSNTKTTQVEEFHFDRSKGLQALLDMSDSDSDSDSSSSSSSSSSSEDSGDSSGSSDEDSDGSMSSQESDSDSIGNGTADKRQTDDINGTNDARDTKASRRHRRRHHLKKGPALVITGPESENQPSVPSSHMSSSINTAADDVGTEMPQPDRDDRDEQTPSGQTTDSTHRRRHHKKHKRHRHKGKHTHSKEPIAADDPASTTNEETLEKEAQDLSLEDGAGSQSDGSASDSDSVKGRDEVDDAESSNATTSNAGTLDDVQNESVTHSHDTSHEEAVEQAEARPNDSHDIAGSASVMRKTKQKGSRKKGSQPPPVSLKDKVMRDMQGRNLNRRESSTFSLSHWTNLVAQQERDAEQARLLALEQQAALDRHRQRKRTSLPSVAIPERNDHVDAVNQHIQRYIDALLQATVDETIKLPPLPRFPAPPRELEQALRLAEQQSSVLNGDAYEEESAGETDSENLQDTPAPDTSLAVGDSRFSMLFPVDVDLQQDNPTSPRVQLSTFAQSRKRGNSGASSSVRVPSTTQQQQQHEFVELYEPSKGEPFARGKASRRGQRLRAEVSEERNPSGRIVKGPALSRNASWASRSGDIVGMRVRLTKSPIPVSDLHHFVLAPRPAHVGGMLQRGRGATEWTEPLTDRSWNRRQQRTRGCIAGSIDALQLSPRVNLVEPFELQIHRGSYTQTRRSSSSRPKSTKHSTTDSRGAQRYTSDTLDALHLEWQRKAWEEQERVRQQAEWEENQGQFSLDQMIWQANLTQQPHAPGTERESVRASPRRRLGLPKYEFPESLTPEVLDTGERT